MSFSQPEDDRWLSDILTHIELVDQFIAGRDFDAFVNDVQTVYAVTRCLEIISEASRRVSEALKSRHQHIPWKDMAGAGNVYRHDYEDVGSRAVWHTVKNSPPHLRGVIELELARPR